MPITPWGDKIQLILNPLGVIGRTNTGQIFELYTNLI
jgi:DNA-directed RNA polymerase beta subunit